MSAVTTPVATPREKEPLKTPRNIPNDLSSAMTSKVWLLSPCGWYATIDLKHHRKQTINDNMMETKYRGCKISALKKQNYLRFIQLYRCRS